MSWHDRIDSIIYLGIYWMFLLAMWGLWVRHRRRRLRG